MDSVFIGKTAKALPDTFEINANAQVTTPDGRFAIVKAKDMATGQFLDCTRFWKSTLAKRTSLVSLYEVMVIAEEKFKSHLLMANKVPLPKSFVIAGDPKS